MMKGIATSAINQKVLMMLVGRQARVVMIPLV